MTNASGNAASFFANEACPHFPCHAGIEPSEFNCMFCYCPLFALGPDCGGDYAYLENGVKDCSRCTVMHRGDCGVRRVEERFKLLADLASDSRK